MIKRLAWLIVPILLVLLLPSVALALPELQSYEEYTTGDDSAYEVYGNTWLGQTFTITPESHSIKQVRILGYRDGDPGTITVSIRETDDSGLPMGEDLTSGTFDGDTATNDTGGEWYGVTLTETSLDYDETYAIVIRAEAGDSLNSFYIRYDGSSATEADGSEVNSSDGGFTWTADTDDDLLFEVRGRDLVELTQAKVYRGYDDDDDMLFVVQYYNVYTPYYPNEDSNYYFVLQLRSTNGTDVIAQTSCKAWGNKPGAIYLNADSAASLTPGEAYRLYIYSEHGAEPEDYYTLTGADWRGEDLTLLDSWVISTARDISDYYGVDLTTYTDTEVLNEQGGVIFATGIPGLQYNRPDIFSVSVYIPEYDEEEWDDGYEESTTWQAQVGSDATAALTSIADIWGLDARDMGGMLVLVLYLGACLIVMAKGGDAAVAAVLAIPVVLIGTWLHLLNIALITVIVAVGVLLAMYRFWWSRT